MEVQGNEEAVVEIQGDIGVNNPIYITGGYGNVVSYRDIGGELDQLRADVAQIQQDLKAFKGDLVEWIRLLRQEGG